MSGTHAQARAAMAARATAYAGLDPAWHRAMAEVPREHFIPDRVWRNDGGKGTLVDRRQEPEAWEAMLHDEFRSIVTQLDDGAEHGPGHFTSSASMPVVVARMLAEIPKVNGLRVLEIGAGTGYNAALLAHRFGARNVVSVEIDPGLADRARAALARAGFPSVEVITGDGVDRLGELIPGHGFDVLICTCEIAYLPAAWLDAVPSGVIIAPFSPGWLSVGCLVLHTGERNSGRIKAGFSFMNARGHRWAAPRPPAENAEWTRHSELEPYRVTSSCEAAAFAVSMQLPGVDYWIQDDPDGIRRLTLWDNRQPQSWAAVQVERGQADGWAARGAGPRELWSEVEAAYRRWAHWGEPGPDRYTVTASRNAVTFSLGRNTLIDVPAWSTGSE